MQLKALRPGRLVAWICVAGMLVSLPAARAQASPYDRPVRKVVVDLGPSEYSPGSHGKLYCDYYPRFLVKELDLGQEGDEWIGIVPMPEGKAPKCRQAKGEGEIRLDQQDSAGYFSGVVGNLVFIDDADGLNESLGFAIFDAVSGRMLFRDQAERKIKMKGGKLVWEGERLRIERTPKSLPVLTYTRAYFADCSLQKNGAACWNKIRGATALPEIASPTCTDDYKDDADDPSVIFFPVRVVLGPKLELQPLPGPVRCEARE